MHSVSTVSRPDGTVVAACSCGWSLVHVFGPVLAVAISEHTRDGVHSAA